MSTTNPIIRPPHHQAAGICNGLALETGDLLASSGSPDPTGLCGFNALAIDDAHPLGRSGYQAES